MRTTLFFTIMCGMCLASLSATAQQTPSLSTNIASDQVTIHSIYGEQRLSYLKEVSAFYNAFYRNPPYFYDNTVEAWDGYIQSFINEPESILCLAMYNNEIIGAIIGTPLAKTTMKYKEAFLNRPEDLHSLYFLGELSVKPEYMHTGANKLLYVEFENQVAQKPQFSGISVWQLQSEIPNASGDFWREMGFHCSDVHFEEMWKDTFGTEKVPHSMISWKKLL